MKVMSRRNLIAIARLEDTVPYDEQISSENKMFLSYDLSKEDHLK